MRESWTGDLIGKMHNSEIRLKELAEVSHLSTAYVCMILNGKRNPPDARERLESAFEQIVSTRNKHTTKPVQ